MGGVTTKPLTLEQVATLAQAGGLLISSDDLPEVTVRVNAFLDQLANKMYEVILENSFDRGPSPAEVTALTSRARLFVGNDSGIAHIAAAAGAPCVVVFGSSNVTHWRPWTTNANEVVREEMPCQPCHGYFCAEFEKPECILRIPVERVIGAIDRILDQAHGE